MKDMNEAQKRLKPLIDKAMSKKADAALAYQKAADEAGYASGILRQTEHAFHALQDAFNAVGDVTP